MPTPRLTLLVLAGPALLAAGIALYATGLGIGVTPDAVTYLDAARHLALGDGFVTGGSCSGALTPVTHFPPLYPWLLSVGVRLGLAPAAAARGLQVALFAASVFLAGALVLRATASRWATAVAGLLMATSLGMLEVHTAAWSEGPFLVLALVALGATAETLRTGSRPILVLAGIALGAAAVTRYVGGALVAAAVLAHLVLGSRPLRRRLASTAITALLAAAPLALLVARNLAVSGRPVDRVASLMPLTARHLETLLIVVGAWLLPGSDRAPIFPYQPLLAAIVAATAVFGLALHRGDESSRLHRLFAAVYVALFLVSLATFDHASPIDQRNLAPIFPSLLIVGTCAAHALWRRVGRTARIAVAAGAALLVASSAVSAALAARYLHERGRGFLGRDWQYQHLTAAVARLPPETCVFSNYPAAIVFLADRGATDVPSPARAERMKGHPAALVYFSDARRFTPEGSPVDPGPGEPAAAALARSVGWVEIDRERNGVLFAPTAP